MSNKSLANTILGTDLLAIARTDSEAATLITSTIDPRDHAFILGTTNRNLQPLNDLMLVAENSGKAGDELQAVEDQWVQNAGLKLFDEAVIDVIKASSASNKSNLVQKYQQAVKGKSNAEARALAKQLTGQDIYFNWDSARTREGYYRYKGGCQCAVNRAVAFAPYADAIWMESKLPDFAQAKEFADGVHAVWPEQK
jgi:isocitrate lyase